MTPVSAPPYARPVTRLFLAALMLLWLAFPLADAVAKPSAKKKHRQSEPKSGQGDRDRKARAAAFFAKGQEHYNSGRFAQAIIAFSEADKLATHPATLFNIARCHENLGRPQEALVAYRKALSASKDPQLQRDLRGRIRRLERFPGKIFISSQPPGAHVTIDGNTQPEARTTPLVAQVPAGKHVLLFRLAGHLLAAKPVEVAAGREATLHVVLEKRPDEPTPCQVCPPKPTCPKCSDPRLLVFEKLHLHVALFGGFGVAKKLGWVGGPGFQATATINRIRIGAHFQYLPVNPASVSLLAGTDQRSTFMQGQLEGGYTFPFGRFHLYATAGLGLYLNRLVKQEGALSTTNEVGGFIWTLGGGIEVLALRWMSLGIGLRAGLMHGELLEIRAKVNPGIGEPLTEFNPVSGTYPFATLWGALNFHI